MLPAVVRAAPGGADPTEYFLTSLHLLVHVGMACKEHRPVPPSPLTPPPPAPLFTEKHNASLHTSGCEQDLVLSHKTAATASAHARRVLALLTSLEPAHAEAANGNGAAKKGGEGAAPPLLDRPPLLERGLAQARTAGSGATPPPPSHAQPAGTAHSPRDAHTRHPLSLVTAALLGGRDGARAPVRRHRPASALRAPPRRPPLRLRPARSPRLRLGAKRLRKVVAAAGCARRVAGGLRARTAAAPRPSDGQRRIAACRRARARCRRRRPTGSSRCRSGRTSSRPAVCGHPRSRRGDETPPLAPALVPRFALSAGAALVPHAAG